MLEKEAEEIIQNWVRNIPAPLVESFSQHARIQELHEYLEQTLNPPLAEAGYKATISLLSAKYNKIVALEIQNTSEISMVENNENDFKVAIEDTSVFCLSFEELQNYLEPDTGLELIAKAEEGVASHLAPIYASNKAKGHRVNLLPFYQGGTVDNKTDYASYFRAASEESPDKDNYITLCSLRAIQNQFFKEHADLNFSHEVMQSASKYKAFSYESIFTAIHLYELAEKKAELLLSQQPKPSYIQLLRSSVTGSNIPAEIITPDYEQEKKHINDFFRFFRYAVEAAIPQGLEFDTIMQDLQAHFPDQQQQGSFIENVKAALKDCDAIISEIINKIQFESNLDEIIDAQQKELLDISIQVTELVLALEASDAQYYDFKATNFFTKDGKLIISDNKTLAQRKDDVVTLGTGHMTYKSPIGEYTEGEGILVRKEWAQNLAKYQIGLMLYDMTMGITGHCEFCSVYRIADAGMTLDFDHPCFQTPTGKILQTQIQALTSYDPAQRPDIDQIRTALVTFKEERARLNAIEEESRGISLPPSPQPLTSSRDSQQDAELSIKEKIMNLQEREPIADENAEAAEEIGKKLG